ncbi:MAG: hypothetical protein HC938_07670 [Nitrospira sp.]|nr:hypothetical protein [Nitrospira sp.]
MVEQVRFDSAYIFKYSERMHTIAARKYADDIPDRVKGMRVAQLIEIQRRITLERNRRYIGQALEVLVEGDATRSSSQGMGENRWKHHSSLGQEHRRPSSGQTLDETHRRCFSRNSLREVIIPGACAVLLMRHLSHFREQFCTSDLGIEHFLTTPPSTF